MVFRLILHEVVNSKEGFCFVRRELVGQDFLTLWSLVLLYTVCYQSFSDQGQR